MEKEETPQTLKRLFAEEITERIHGTQALRSVLQVTQLLFDPRAGRETLLELDARTLAQVAHEVPAPQVSKIALAGHLNVLDFLSQHTGITTSRGEAKKAIQNNAISINKQKISDLDATVSGQDLLHGRFLLVENGKKNKYLVQAL